jgi:hypothetical protein
MTSNTSNKGDVIRCRENHEEIPDRIRITGGGT